MGRRSLACVLLLLAASGGAQGRPPAAANEAFAAGLAGLRLNEAGLYLEAIPHHTRSIELRPTASAHANRALALLRTGKVEAAIADCDAALRLDPRHVRARIQRAEANRCRGAFAEALRDCDEALRLRPGDADALAERAVVRLALGVHAGAGEDARAALEAQGWRHPDAARRAVLAHLAFRSAGRLAEARAVLDAAAERCDPAAWPFPIVRYLRREVAAEALVAEAAGEAERAEARAVLGLERVAAGEAEAARADLAWAREHAAPTEIAHALAGAALARLGPDPASLPGGAKTVNGSRPGERIEIAEHVVRGKTTIFDFYSDDCPPCRRLSPRLTALAQARPEIAVRKVDIDRRGTSGIDWGSPVVEQYGIRAVPHLKIYGPDGRLVAEGSEASSRVERWLREAGIR